MRKFFFLAALCCAMMANAAQFDGLKTITSGGVERQYYLYVPNTLKANSPIFISCHGMDQDYRYQKTSQMKWMPLMADTASFVVVYPVGVSGTVWGQPYTTGWNINDMTDVNFMLDIVSDVKANYGIDDTRLYMSGFSLGGVFAYYMAQKAPNRVAAVVSFSGYDLTGADISCSRPIPIFHLHGTSDNVMNYDGLENYLKKWSRLFSCSSTADVTYYPLAYGSGQGTLMTYKDCECDVEVKLLKAPDVQHDWSCIQNGSNEVATIWNFCKQYNTSCGKINTEGIENTAAEAKSIKRIENGQLLIDCNGRTYNAQGAEIH